MKVINFLAYVGFIGIFIPQCLGFDLMNWQWWVSSIFVMIIDFSARQSVQQ